MFDYGKWTKKEDNWGRKNLSLDFFFEFLRKLKFICGGNWWLLKCNGVVIVGIGFICKVVIRDCWIVVYFIYIYKEEIFGLVGIRFYY